MPVLQPNEYDASYFDGNSQPMRHNAGYSRYERWNRNDGANSTGEFWLDKATEIVNLRQLQGKKVLEIGSAKGFLVEDMRALGVDAYGLDVSQYAYDQASPAVQPFLTVGDARTALASYRNKEFDWVISLRTLECFEGTDLTNVINEMNRISRNQFHVIDESGNSNFYVIQPLSWWVQQPFSKGTIIASNQSQQFEVV